MAEQPTGIVSLLFTDIEGSTRRWERDPAGMKVALARHHTLLRSAIEANDGHVFQIVGDGFCTAFCSAGAALNAAAAAQRALLAEPWGDLGPIRVRMAVHTGVVEARDGDYASGPSLNRVSRLLSLAHGGQVLVSTVAADLAYGQFADDIHLRDLGEHRLRDLAHLERIFQLVAPGLPDDFPPLHPTQSLDAHYEVLVKAITENRVVLFLGEEVNLCGRTAGLTWQHGQAECLPTVGELAGHLAKSFGYPGAAPQDLLRVAQYISVMSGSGPLYEELHALLDADYHPNALHGLIARLPETLRSRGYAGGYPLVVTTNYDDALERAFQAAGEPFDLVWYAAEGEHRGRFWHRPPDARGRLIDKPNKYLGLRLTERPVILKIHGAVDRANSEHDSFVITEDDYLDYLTRADISNLVPVTLAARLRRSHYLFLGYSLHDWNLRVILHRLWGEQRLTYKSWAAQVNPDALDREFWRKRDVDVLPASLDEYVVELDERLQTLPARAGPDAGATAPAPIV